MSTIGCPQSIQAAPTATWRLLDVAAVSNVTTLQSGTCLEIVPNAGFMLAIAQNASSANTAKSAVVQKKNTA
jgi:hypothetical protein